MKYFILITITHTVTFAPAITADESPVPLPVKSETNLPDATGLAPVKTADNESAEKKISDWRPGLLISLSITTDLSSHTARKVAVTSREGLGGSAREVTHYKTVNVVQPVQAVLACDDVSVTASPNEKGDVNYSVTCEKQAFLLISGMAITAESLELKDGLLAIKNAKIQHGGVSASAPSLEFKLRIHGVSTRSFGQPVANVSIPTMIRVLDPNDRSLPNVRSGFPQERAGFEEDSYDPVPIPATDRSIGTPKTKRPADSFDRSDSFDGTDKSLSTSTFRRP